MLCKVKNIGSLLLLLVFLLPTIVKLEHRHEHFECKAKNIKHFQVLHGKCAVCNFEFSVFFPDFASHSLSKEQNIVKYFNNYHSVNYTHLSKYSFLLRAPPFLKFELHHHIQ